MGDKHITRLEEKLAFQEDLLERLNHAVAQQQLVINDLERKCRILFDRLEEISDGRTGIRESEEKPPHY